MNSDEYNELLSKLKDDLAKSSHIYNITPDKGIEKLVIRSGHATIEPPAPFNNRIGECFQSAQGDQVWGVVGEGKDTEYWIHVTMVDGGPFMGWIAGIENGIKVGTIEIIN